MTDPFNVSLGIFAQTSAAAAATRLSDLELIGRYPALAAAARILLWLGLSCDGYLLWRWAAARRAAPDAATPLLRVPPQPWGMTTLALAAALMLLASVGLDVVLWQIASLSRLNEDACWVLLLAGEMLLRLGILLGALAHAHRHRLDWQRVLGLQSSSRRRGIVLGVIFYCAMTPPLALVAILSSVCYRMLGREPTAQFVAELLATSASRWVVGLIVGLAVLVAPVFEEVLFRGLVYPALKQRWGAARALVMVSAVFALIHLHAPSVAPLFALGLALGLAYELTGSLLAPITMHALFNTTNVIMLLYVRAHS